MSYQQKADALFESQKQDWPLLGENWRSLEDVRLRNFYFDGYSIRVQFNPERITSSAAKVDQKSIENRPCFLCPENRPPEQKLLMFEDQYEILCNPYPIFHKHFTVVRPDHTPQVIDTEFSGMLDLGRALTGLVVFYNAPACGASAPDHMHFQAGNRGFLPMEEELGNLIGSYGDRVIEKRDLKLTAIDDGLRRFFLLESTEKQALMNAFSKLSLYARQLQDGKESMLNILCNYRDTWQLMIFPREKHRPWQYFEEGEKHIMLSPASVDMGGILITPLEKDFIKITKEDIMDIFSQVCLPLPTFRDMTDHIKAALTHGT